MTGANPISMSRASSLRGWSVLSVCWLVASCSTATPTEPDNPPPIAVAPTEPEPKLATPVEPVHEEPYAPNPAGIGDPCTDDGDCGWDDPCVASRCVGAAWAPDPIGCEKSAPAPGECLCVAGACSLKPAPIPADAPSCRFDSCGLDQGAGRCVAGSMLDANRRIRDVGPACPCDSDSLECRFVWVEPIPCETVADCWVSDGYPHYPIARPKALRNKKFRPCQDGEVAPGCTDGRCSLAAFSC